MTQVMIVRRPKGEAPEWVRDAWIGLVLPSRDARPRSYRSFGVLTGPKWGFFSWFALALRKSEVVAGHVVPSKTALDLLADRNPDAAAWWRKNAPQYFRRGQYFLFDTEACETGLSSLPSASND